MAIIHNCDVCKRAITGERTTVDTRNYHDRFEFCENCPAPILAVLKKYKLSPAI